MKEACLKASDEFKRSNWSFTPETYSDLKKLFTEDSRLFFSMIGLECQDEYPTFNEIKTRIDVFQPQKIPENVQNEFINFITWSEKPQTTGILINWMKNALDYKFKIEKINFVKETLPEIYAKIQNTIKNINKLTKDKQKIETSIHDVKNYFVSEKSYGIASTEVTCLSKTRSKPSTSNESHSITNFPSLKIEHKEYYGDPIEKYKETHYTSMIYEDDTELKRCNSRYFCC
jgi:hypothetical protein